MNSWKLVLCHFNLIVLFILIYNIHLNSISRQNSSLLIVVIRYRHLFSVGRYSDSLSTVLLEWPVHLRLQIRLCFRANKFFRISIPQGNRWNVPENYPCHARQRIRMLNLESYIAMFSFRIIHSFIHLSNYSFIHLFMFKIGVMHHRIKNLCFIVAWGQAMIQVWGCDEWAKYSLIYHIFHLELL